MKSLGPDGFGACFYQNPWMTVGNDVCAAVLKILRGDGMISSLNYTYVAYVYVNHNMLWTLYPLVYIMWYLNWLPNHF